jgi:hypothetical protein
MIKQNQRALVILFVIVLMFGCAPISAPVVPPTSDPFSINTIIAQTANAAATQTFAVLPTQTLLPTSTRTPTEIPTSTPTFIFILPTATVPSPTPTLDKKASPYACKILSQTPVNDSGIPPGKVFDTHWQVLNTGSAVWDSNNIDYRYAGGEKMHTTSIYDLNKSVSPGEEVDVYVNMKAPKDAGTYTTVWAFRVGKAEFCRMKLTIVVN